MKNIYSIITLFSICFFYQSCEQESIEDIKTQTAVVEAYLFADQSIQNIKISQSFSYAQFDTIIQTLDNLDVYISDDNNMYPLFSKGNGLYENSDVKIEDEKNYYLEFTWQSQSIRAETYIPGKKEADITTELIEMEKIEIGAGGFPGGFGGGLSLDPIDIKWNNAENDYYYVVIDNIEDDPEYVNDRIAQFEEENGGRRRFSFISEPQIMDVYSLNPQRDLTQFGTYRIIVFRVNPEYAGLYESSGSSTLSLVQPPSNIENGLGLFTGVNSDTLYLEVLKK